MWIVRVGFFWAIGAFTVGAISPATLDGAQIGLYTFDDGTPFNQFGGPGALPDLTGTGVSFSGGAAVFDSVFDHLELPVALGVGPFTIFLDATYDPQPISPNFAVSQFGATNFSTDVDFIIQQFPGTSNRAEFFNGEGVGIPIDHGSIDGGRHRIAITWDGSTIGNFFDGTLVTAGVVGTLPDIDASVLRFGAESLNDGIGATGSVHEIRIFDTALSEAELNSINSAGTLVGATGFTRLSGLAFSHGGCESGIDLFGQVIDSTVTFSSIADVKAGSGLRLASGSDVTIISATGTEFRPGFIAESGSTLTVGADPGLTCP